jgi:hypothetical protein
MKFLIPTFVFIFILPLAMASAPSEKYECQVEIKELNTCAHFSWTEGPHWGKFSSGVLRYWKKDDLEQTLVDPEMELVVYPWMIMEKMEHGGRAPTVKKVSEGVFEVSGLQFGKMPGYWQVRLKKPRASERTGALGIFPVPLEES